VEILEVPSLPTVANKAGNLGAMQNDQYMRQIWQGQPIRCGRMGRPDLRGKRVET